MLNLITLDASFPHLSESRALYERAFPENERRDFDDMLYDSSGICNLLAIMDHNHFIGFACILYCCEIAHIIYFAIDENLRGQGLGTAALQAIHRLYAPHRVVVDIERCGDQYADHVLRSARKAFYLRAGYQENPVYYRWQQEDYEVLSYGGGISGEEFGNFWDTAYAANLRIG